VTFAQLSLDEPVAAETTAHLIVTWLKPSLMAHAHYRALTGITTLRSPRGNLCGAPVYARGMLLTISFPELAYAQRLSLSQRNFDAVR
jgi:hypothetical protein